MSWSCWLGWHSWWMVGHGVASRMCVGCKRLEIVKDGKWVRCE